LCDLGLIYAKEPDHQLKQLDLKIRRREKPGGSRGVSVLA
jgi:hypothetical protein